MELILALKLGWLNGWILLVVEFSIQGFLLLVFLKDVVARLFDRSGWSVKQHPGDTVSCTQAEAMIRAAEAKTGLRPWRRTDLLSGRIRSLEDECQKYQSKAQACQTAREQTQVRLMETRQQWQGARATVLQLEAQYQGRKRRERPYSALAKARQRLSMLERRQGRLDKQIVALEKQLRHRQQQLLDHQAQIHRLKKRLEHFEAENRTNHCPIQADYRLDAGFGSRENVALLIEMGYETYTKPYSDWLTPCLKKRVCPLTQ